MLMLNEILQSSSLYQQALELRYELFFKDFDLPKSVTADELESNSTHVALSMGDKLLAYGRLSPLDATSYRISQIVVSLDCRRKRYASRIVLALLSRAESRRARIIVLNSQLAVLPLYRKLGFREVGDVYEVKLTGLKHQKMVYEFQPYDT